MDKLSNQEISEIFNLNRINSTIELDNEEAVWDFVRPILNDDLIFFDKPVHVNDMNWALSINRNICIIADDPHKSDYIYVFAMMKQESASSEIFYDAKRKASDQFDILVGAGSAEGVEYIE